MVDISFDAMLQQLTIGNADFMQSSKSSNGRYVAGWKAVDAPVTVADKQAGRIVLKANVSDVEFAGVSDQGQSIIVSTGSGGPKTEIRIFDRNGDRVAFYEYEVNPLEAGMGPNGHLAWVEFCNSDDKSLAWRTFVFRMADGELISDDPGSVVEHNGRLARKVPGKSSDAPEPIDAGRPGDRTPQPPEDGPGNSGKSTGTSDHGGQNQRGGDAEEGHDINWPILIFGIFMGGMFAVAFVMAALDEAGIIETDIGDERQEGAKEPGPSNSDDQSALSKIANGPSGTPKRQQAQTKEGAEKEEAERPEEEGPRDYSSVAMRICNDLIRKRLKSPSTADFPWTPEKIEANPENGVYVIGSYVDSQNGFGATIRTRFECKLERDPQDGWDLLDMKVR